jgi:hypothetical protein
MNIVDINGDRLPDIIKSNDESGNVDTYAFYLNNGNGWDFAKL